MTENSATETVDTVDAAELAADAAESDPEAITPDAVETPDEDTNDDVLEDRGKDREAARYRRQLRAAEAERDAVNEQLTVMGERVATMQRGEAERLAAEHLADGADLWRDGAELAGMLDDSGQVDPEKVRQAAKATAAAHRHWAVRPPVQRNPAGRGGFHSGATGGDVHRSASWTSVLNTRAGDD